MPTRYDRNRAARQAQNERALMGESLAAFHARENAPPPTLAQIFAENRKNKTPCRSTFDLFGSRTLDLFTDQLAPDAGEGEV